MLFRDVTGLCYEVSVWAERRIYERQALSIRDNHLALKVQMRQINNDCRTWYMTPCSPIEWPPLPSPRTSNDKPRQMKETASGLMHSGCLSRLLPSFYQRPLYSVLTFAIGVKRVNVSLATRQASTERRVDAENTVSEMTVFMYRGI